MFNVFMATTSDKHCRRSCLTPVSLTVSLVPYSMFDPKEEAKRFRRLLVKAELLESFGFFKGARVHGADP